MNDNEWKETVREIYDLLHFGQDSIFSGEGRPLARRLVDLIEARHPDFFVETRELTKGERQ